MLEVRIDDEGPGLQNTGNLFVPFFTTKPGGSGIGLVLSRQIAEGHGGSLTLENRSRRARRARDAAAASLDPAGLEDPPLTPTSFGPAEAGHYDFFSRRSSRSASVLSTLMRAKFLSLPSTSVHGATRVLVRATISSTASV